jgi:SWI2/SNF2 ATPase
MLRMHGQSIHCWRNHGGLPNAAIIGFTGTPILSHEKTQSREIFGEFIDKYLLQDAELDGATVPILYEGRTANGLVKDAPGLDELFEDSAEVPPPRSPGASSLPFPAFSVLLHKFLGPKRRHSKGLFWPAGNNTPFLFPWF